MIRLVSPEKTIITSFTPLIIMCRWVVYVGVKVLLADILVRPRHSLICQTHERYLPNCTTQWTMSNMVSMIKRNAAVNADGFGVGWYNLEVDEEPCVFTSIAPAEHNVNLARLSKKIQSHMIFGHVRAASPGSPVNDTNCHPFQFGRYLWMHNGCIANWSIIKRPITALLSRCSYAYISGTTDSEIAGALFVDQLPNHNPSVEHSPEIIMEAMQRTIQIIVNMAHSLYVSGSGESVVSSLNFAVADGKTVVCTRYRDSIVEEPPSLYYCPVTHMEMVSSEMEIFAQENFPVKGVIITSEPLTYRSENWTLIPKNHMICVTDNTNITIVPIDDHLSNGIDEPETADPVQDSTATNNFLLPQWLKSVEKQNDVHCPISIEQLTSFFLTPCCSEFLPSSSFDDLPNTCISTANSSPSTYGSDGRGYYNNNKLSKSSAILQSPAMACALRALLASATPSQFKEILQSTLLPPAKSQIVESATATASNIFSALQQPTKLAFNESENPSYPGSASLSRSSSNGGFNYQLNRQAGSNLNQQASLHGHSCSALPSPNAAGLAYSNDGYSHFTGNDDFSMGCGNVQWKRRSFSSFEIPSFDLQSGAVSSAGTQAFVSPIKLSSNHDLIDGSNNNLPPPKVSSDPKSPSSILMLNYEDIHPGLTSCRYTIQRSADN